LCLGGGGDSSSLDEDEDEDEGEGGSSLRFLEEEDFLDACLFLDRLSSTEVGGKRMRYLLFTTTKRKGRDIFPIFTGGKRWK